MPDKQPNIVFILAENVGWGDWACYGGQTPTPRIDKLASEGIRFNSYTTESQCCPTRTALLTGRQSVRCGTYSVVPHGAAAQTEGTDADRAARSRCADHAIRAA